MKKVIKAFFFTAIVISHFTALKAQVVVEEIVTTDTVDIFATLDAKSKQAKSPGLAMLGNILIPGLGHQYIGNYSRALGYFGAEAFFIFGMIFCERYSKKLYADSRSYAWKYANTHCRKDPDDIYWRIIGDKYFTDFKKFNDAVEHNRDFDQKYVKPDERWWWDNDIYQENYRNTRNDATRFHIVSSFFLGAMLLNRAVSFIDIRIASKYGTVQSQQTGIGIQPHYSLTSKEVGISLTKNF